MGDETKLRINEEKMSRKDRTSRGKLREQHEKKNEKKKERT